MCFLLTNYILQKALADRSARALEAVYGTSYFVGQSADALGVKKPKNEEMKQAYTYK